MVYFRTNPLVLGLLLFVILRNSYNWEGKRQPLSSETSSILSSYIKTKVGDTFKSYSDSRNTDLNSSQQSEKLDLKKTPTLKSNERDTLFRYTFMFPAPKQDLSRSKIGNKTRFYSQYSKVVKIHFYLLVLPVIFDMILLIIFNLKNDWQYQEHMTMIFGKNNLVLQYMMKSVLIALR